MLETATASSAPPPAARPSRPTATRPEGASEGFGATLREGASGEGQPGSDGPREAPFALAHAGQAAGRAEEPRPGAGRNGGDGRPGDGTPPGHARATTRRAPGAGDLPLAAARPAGPGLAAAGAAGAARAVSDTGAGPLVPASLGASRSALAAAVGAPGAGPLPPAGQVLHAGAPEQVPAQGRAMVSQGPAGIALPPAAVAAGAAEPRPATAQGTARAGATSAGGAPVSRSGASAAASQPPSPAADSGGEAGSAAAALRDPSVATGHPALGERAHAASREPGRPDSAQAPAARQHETGARALHSGARPSQVVHPTAQDPAAAPFAPLAEGAEQVRGAAVPDGRGPDSMPAPATPPPADMPRGVTATGPSVPADAGRPAAQQLADAARPLPDGPVEVRLEPEELGRVRMVLSAADGSMSVSLAAEREETALLLRRHIEELAQEFRALGYTDVRFSFEQDGSGGRSDEDRAAGPASAVEPAPAPAEPGETADLPSRGPALSVPGRIDMRL